MVALASENKRFTFYPRVGSYPGTILQLCLMHDGMVHTGRFPGIGKTTVHVHCTSYTVPKTAGNSRAFACRLSVLPAPILYVRVGNIRQYMSLFPEWEVLPVVSCCLPVVFRQ